MAKKEAQMGTEAMDPKKAKNQEKKALKKARLTMVADYVLSHSDDPELIAAANAVKPGNRVARTGMKNVISDAFVSVGDQMGEDRIWDEYKLGRKEMRSITNNLIKKANPEDRKWVSFDSENGVYTLEGIGANPPSGWTGYTPAKLEDIQVL